MVFFVTPEVQKASLCVLHDRSSLLEVVLMCPISAGEEPRRRDIVEKYNGWQQRMIDNRRRSREG